MYVVFDILCVRVLPWQKLEGSFPEGSPPSPEAAWAAGCDLIAELGDPDSAARSEECI